MSRSISRSLSRTEAGNEPTSVFRRLDRNISMTGNRGNYIRGLEVSVQEAMCLEV